MVDIHTEARLSLESQGTWCQPPLWKTMLDKEGCLTLKLTLDAPLEEIELAVGRILRLCRPEPRKTRNRPDKDAAALETWACYEETKRFSVVAKQLQRPVNTVKRQYVRGFELIHGQRPTGTIKQRRAGIMIDPATDYRNHEGSCVRCKKANTIEQMCPKFVAFLTQDTSALRELIQ